MSSILRFLFSLNITNVTKQTTRYVGQIRKVRNVYQIFVRKSAEKSGRETGFNWLWQDTVKHSNKHFNSIKYGEIPLLQYGKVMTLT
jgi:hypothetical protein